MRFLRLDENARFSNKQIVVFLLPMFFEQLMMSGLNIADTFMVSNLGEIAVAGVALVSRIDNFVKQFLLALAQGGSVIMSQYIGAKDEKLARTSLKNNVRIVIIIGLIIMAIMVLLRPWILNTLYGNAEKEVLDISLEYFNITAFSYPLVALYYSGSASFRAMGESKVPSVAAICMMIINLTLKYTFIFKMNMGVKGAALSTLIAMATVGTVMFIGLHAKRNKVRLEGFFRPQFEGENAGRILKISVPNGIEQGMFQLGALLIAGLVSGLGTAAIAADSISRTICGLIHSFGSGFVAFMMMVIGQCMGAGRPDEAEFYTKHILKINYLLTFFNVLIVFVLLKPLISLYDVSAQAQSYAFRILLIYGIGSMFFYPTSFATAAALRGAGDTKFVMLVASCSMFLFRIGAAYIFVYVFRLGILGPWIAMVSDWVIRSAVFAIRFKGGKWAKNKVI